MKHHLTIAYFTSRKEPCFRWFLDSLHRELNGDYENVRVVIVDFWCDPRVAAEFGEPLLRVTFPEPHRIPPSQFHWVSPKPSVWQGADRLTKQHWFAASNARNTALCMAPDGWIAFVDDLSILRPGWGDVVRAAVEGDPKTITLGAYRKVRELAVQNGEAVSHSDYPPGHDNRLKHVSGPGPHVAAGQWLYGCSLVGPVEAFLEIGGYFEGCDSLGFEDCIAGLMLEKKGYRFLYHPGMMTWESDELHQQQPVMRREDYGVSPNDKSHAVLNQARNGTGWEPNYFGDEGIRGLRQRVLAGEPFPVLSIPQHEFFTGKPLSEL